MLLSTLSGRRSTVFSNDSLDSLLTSTHLTDLKAEITMVYQLPCVNVMKLWTPRHSCIFVLALACISLWQLMIIQLHQLLHTNQQLMLHKERTSVTSGASYQKPAQKKYMSDDFQRCYARRDNRCDSNNKVLAKLETGLTCWTRLRTLTPLLRSRLWRKNQANSPATLYSSTFYK